MAATATTSVDAQIEGFVHKILVNKLHSYIIKPNRESNLEPLHIIYYILYCLSPEFLSRSLVQNVTFLEEAFGCVIVHQQNIGATKVQHLSEQMSECLIFH